MLSLVLYQRCDELACLDGYEKDGHSEMKRRNAMILTLVALIAAGCFIWFSAPDSSDDPAGVLPRFLARLSQPHPHSDVGITSDVG